MKIETDFEVNQICIALKDGVQLVKTISFTTDGETVTAYVHPLDKDRWSGTGFSVPETQLIEMPVDEDGEFIPIESSHPSFAKRVGDCIINAIPSRQILKLNEIREESRKKRIPAETTEQTTNSQPVNS